MKGMILSLDGDTNFFCHWSFAKKYINTILVHNLPRLCTPTVNRSNKRKWFHTKKGKGKSRQYSPETGRYKLHK